MINLYSAATPNGHKVSNWAWVRTHRWSGVALDDLPHLKRWRDALRQRPATQRGIEQPPSTVDLTRDGDAAAQRLAEQALRMVEMGHSQKESPSPKDATP